MTVFNRTLLGRRGVVSAAALQQWLLPRVSCAHYLLGPAGLLPKLPGFSSHPLHPPFLHTGALLSLVGGVSLSVITLVFPSAIALFGKDSQGGPLVPLGGAGRAFAALICAMGVAIVAFTLASQ